MAIDKGATAILCEQLPRELNPEVTYIQVKDSADALGAHYRAGMDFLHQN